MLILSRKEQEDVIVTVDQKQIVVRVCEIQAGKVRLGFITEHRDIVFDRREIHESKQANTT